MVRPNLTFLLDGASFSRRTLLGLILLILSGYLGNYFHWTLFFSIDFLFGSIAVWLVVCLYGTAWGTVAGFVAGVCSYVLWYHPYAIATFTFEALFVGILFHRKQQSIVLLDAIFWLLIGAPWIWITYPLLMHVDPTQTQFIVLKQAVNGIFNAIVASQLLTYLPIDRWVNRPPVANQFPLQQTLFNLLVAFVFFPTLILILLASHRVVDDIQADARADLNAVSRYLVAETRAWYQQQLQTVSVLAGLAETNQLDVLQERINFDQQTFAHFQAFYVIKADGTLIRAIINPAFHVESSLLKTPSETFDPAFLKQLNSTLLQPTQPNVLLKRQPAQPSNLFFCMPLSAGGEQGFLLGLVDRSKIDTLLHSNLKQQELQITLVNRQKTVIASTQANRLGMQNFDRRKTGATQGLDAETYHWLPTTGISAAMTRWKKSFFVQETLIDRTIYWTLIIEAPAEPRIHYVEKVYSQNLTLLLLVAGFALILANLVSRYFVKPLTQLTAVTTNLPNKLLEREMIIWTPSPITEIALLTHNIQSMASSLKQKFREIQHVNETLERRVQERTQALLQVNAELEAEITERKQAETVQQELSLALANAMPGIARLSSGRYLDVNDAYAQIMGYALDEMLGMPWEATVYTADLAIAITAYEQMLISGKGEFEGRGVRKDGSCFYKQILMVKASAETAGFEGHYCLCRDISDRKQAEETLRRSQSNLLYAQKVAHIGNWEFDITTQTITWSEEVFRICGLDPTQPEPTYAELLQLYHPDDAKQLQQAVKKSIATGEPYDFDLRLFLPDGTLRYINSRGQAICDLEGHAIRLFGTAQDVTDRVQVELALQESRDLFGATFNESTDAILLIDAETSLIFDCNQRTLELFEVDRKTELLNKRGETFHKDPWTAEMVEAVSKTLKQNGIWNGELEYLTLKGNSFWGSISIKLFSIASKPLILVRITDISERIQAERALRISEARNQALINAIPDLMIRMTRDGVYLDFRSSKNFKTYTAYENMVGRSIYDSIPHDLAEERMRYVEQALQTGEIQIYEFQISAEGKHTHEEARIVVSGDDEVLVIVRDMTAHKRAEAAIRSRNQELLTLHKISETILSSQSLRAAFQAIAEEVSTATGFPCVVAIELYDAARQVMVFEGTKGIPMPTHCDVLEVPVDQTLSGIVAMTGQPMIRYFTPQELKQCTANEVLNNLHIKTFICMPMIINQRTIGALSLAYPDEFQADASFLRWVSSLANYLALITDRKQAETSLREGEERLKLALEATQMGIWDLNLLTNQSTWSESCESVYGLAPGSFEGSTAAFLQRVHPEDREWVQRDVIQAIQAGGGLNHEFRIIQTDNSIRWVLERGQVFYDETGRATRLLGIAMDMTDRKRTEEEIRQLNEDLEQRVAQRTAELESLINAMPDYIYVIDRDEMRVSFCNDVFARGTDYRSRHQVKGKTLFECFSAETAAYFIQQNNQVFESGQPLHQQEQLNLPIGSRHFETFKIPLKQPNGQVYALLGTSRDNTSLMEIQWTLSERTTQLEAANRTLEQRNQEMTLLSQMSDLLQACLDQTESRTVMNQLMPRLFPNLSGAVFLINDSHTSVEAMAHFGNDASQMLFAPHDCFALRRGQPHFVDDTCNSLCCKHLLNPLPAAYFCIPMVARGKAIGVLYLSATRQEPFTPANRQLAATAAQQIALALANLRLYETLQNQSIRDPLTGLFNRRYLEESLARELHRAQRSQQNLSIIVLDVDHFKRFNDTFGHDTGDAILRELGTFLQSSVRGSDIACRFGGEEMVLILPGATLDDVRQRAEQLRQGIKQLAIKHDQPVGAITVSLGVACFPKHAASVKALVKAADTALYRAKAEGRDRVIIAD